MNTVNLNVKKFWQSSNFWTAVVLAIGGLFAGFNEQLGTEFVASLFAVVAGGKAFHNFFKKEGIFDKTQFWSVNFWNYVAVIVTSIAPIALPDELFVGLRELIEAFASGNWQAVLTAVFSLVTTIYYIFKNNRGDAKNVNVA